MPDTPKSQNQLPLAELLADPIVQLVMKADGVTEERFIALIGTVLGKLAGGSESVPRGRSAQASQDYRPGVGIMLLNGNNDVFVGRRHTIQGEAWQMPQGGIDEGEHPRAAAFRELKEETGIDNAEVIAETKGWLFYDLPEAFGASIRHAGWRGQRQKWFAMRFKGSDADINIKCSADPEFSAWRWVPMSQLPDLIVPFKRLVYLSVVEEFQNAISPTDES